MIRPITRMGNPRLRKIAGPVSKDYLKTEEINQLLLDMKDSMKHYGGIGIAAPQIGVDLQLAIIELMGVNRYNEDINLPLTAFINPRISYLTEEEQGFWEGCRVADVWVRAPLSLLFPEADNSAHSVER